MPLSTFHVYSPAEFTAWIQSTAFTRHITFIQNHHTWVPGYTHFNNRPNHMYWLESMRRTHINERGWADIGQNITIFPDGKIAVCRSLDKTPAGIYGANTGGICIENLGNFDTGKDAMTQAQNDSIILTNALLCNKFSLSPNTTEVVYHHWYDRAGKRFTSEQINSGFVLRNELQKTCPGTAFFGGNTVTAAEAGFYPLIRTQIAVLQGAAPPAVNTIHKKVNTDVLNVRGGKGVQHAVLRKLSRNAIVEIFAEQDGWSRISSDKEEWVSSQFLSA